MVNDANNSKLDQVVKQTLKNYEASYNANDWSRMETMLNAAPQSAGFKLPNSRRIIIAFLLLGGGFLIFWLSMQQSTQTTVPEVKKPVQEHVSPVTKLPVTVPPSSPPVATTPPESVSQPENNIPPAEIAKRPVTPVAAEKTKENKPSTAAKEEPNKQSVKTQRVIKMGNEPIFGDMLDSSKGVVGKTKEKEEIKKAAKSQPENTIGWNSFLLKNNLDSLKKYHEQQQKDSLKK